MKNKNLFGEARFVLMAGAVPGEAGPVRPKKSPDESAMEFIRDTLFKAEIAEGKISAEVLKKAQEEKSPKFEELITAVKERKDNIPISPQLKAEALREILAGEIQRKVASRAESIAGREALKGEIPVIHPAPPVKLPTEQVLAREVFVARDVTKERNDLDRLKINVNRENLHINAELWDATTRGGLQKIYQNCRDLEIPVSSAYYQSMFAILNNALDQSTNPYLGDTQYRQWFLKPGDHLKEISDLPFDAKTGFSGDQYAKAFEHLIFLQGNILVAQDRQQIETAAAQEKADAEPISGKVTDFVKSNLTKFQKAIRERDYATAGMYAVGIYALYKGFKKVTEGKEDTYGKWLLYGAAAYAGNIFLKNAGYDVLKMAGLRDADYEVKGTPMEVMRGILSGNEIAWRTTNDLDYGIVLRTADVKLTTLEDLYQQSNKNGVQFIHPKELPANFSDLRGVWPFKMGLGERGLSDPGMSDEKLSPAQREYVRVGRQLYKLAFAMRAIYEDTLKKDHTEYKGVPYEEAIKDRTRSMGKVRHLIDAVGPYGVAAPSESILSRKKINEIEDDLREVFKGREESGFWLENEIVEGSGHYKGWLMGFPVVFVRDKDNYRVYLMNEYGGVKVPGANVATIIPKKDAAGRESKGSEAMEKVKLRVLELSKRLQGPGVKSLSATDFQYANGRWTTKVTLPGATAFDIKPEVVDAELTIFAKGDGVSLKTKGGVRINVDEEVERQNPIGIAIIPRIVDQQEYQTLKAFYNAGRIQIGKVDEATKEIVILIGKSNTPLKFTYVGKKFQLDTADEQKLVKDPSFATSYIEALEADEQFELNEVIKKLKGSIKNAPEGFWKHMWQKLTLGSKDSPVSGINLDVFSGSIPEYFSNTVLDVTKYEALQKLRRGMAGATNLQDVEAVRKATLVNAQTSLEAVYETLSSENVSKDSWDRNEFIDRILYPIRAASSISSAYNRTRNEFEYKVYEQIGGLLKSSDLSTASHDKARDLLNVFAYYTVHLDNHEYSYEDPNEADPSLKHKTAKVDLDNLTFPPKAEFGAGTQPIYKDPGLRGHLILNYYEYVKSEMLDRIRGQKLNIIPNGSAGNFWKIMEFEKWAETNGKYAPLDSLDNQPAYTHDVTEHEKPGYTELELAIRDEFDRTAAYLSNEYPDILSYPAIQAYLRRKQAETPDDLSRVGLFRIIEDPPNSKNYRSQLWDWGNGLATLTTRGQQMKEIKKIVDRELVRHIFENKDDFFIKAPSFTTMIRQRWPWLSQYF